MAEVNVVDTRLLGKPASFEGKDEQQWILWQFVFKAYIGAVSDNILQGMLRVEDMADEVDNARLTATNRASSLQLYHILAMLLTGRAQRILMR
eukprot:2754410-Alexandrium_andersonii.AAC.1